MRVLRRVPQREMIGAGIVFRKRGTRLDCVRDQSIVDEVELGDVICRFERRFDRLRVADVPLVDGVARRNGVDLQRPLRLRIGDIANRRQHLVIDFHLLGGILGLGQRLGHDHSDGIADVIGLPVGERWMRRHLHLRSVLGCDHPPADEIADLVGGKLGSG